jgi:hypothetical protein
MNLLIGDAYMKAKMTILLLTLVVSACAAQPTSIITADGKQLYAFNCRAGLEKCYQQSRKWCPAGYDIFDHSKKTSTVVPHYGEYPMILTTESLTIQCK